MPEEKHIPENKDLIAYCEMLPEDITKNTQTEGLLLKVPAQFRVLFWDTDLEAIDVEKHKIYIIERLLDFGDEDAYRWLFKVYSDTAIITVIRESRRITPQTAMMMANFYGLPQEELRCLKTASGQVPYGF